MPFAALALAALAAVPAEHPPTSQSTTLRASVDSSGAQANKRSWYCDVSADGRFVAFESEATNLVPGDTNNVFDVFVHDLLTGVTERVSVNAAGVQGDFLSARPALSADGRFVAFMSLATNLDPADTNNKYDVYVRDRMLGVVERVSVSSSGAQVSRDSDWPTISGDGRYVAFWSEAINLVPGDTNGVPDVFLRDRTTSTTTRVSVASGGVQGNDRSLYPRLSRDGSRVIFESSASNLWPGDANGVWDVFVHEIASGLTTCVSVNPAGIPGNGGSGHLAALSADGRWACFTSGASDLVPGDANGYEDVFVRDLLTGITEMASVSSAGLQGNGSSGDERVTISGNARFVGFSSNATTLVIGDTNATTDIFVRDRLTGTTTRVSVATGGGQSNHQSNRTSISGDGRIVAFHSHASNLVVGDSNGQIDVFVHDRGPVGLALTRGGTCPGATSLAVAGATPGGTVLLLSGPAGSTTRGGPPCAGLTLAIAPPTLRAARTADGAGAVALSFNAPAGACGATVQAVDVAACAVSNVVVL